MLYALLVVAVIRTPWPIRSCLISPALILLVVLDGTRLQRRIRHTRGKIALLRPLHVTWQGITWQLAAAPLITRYGIWLQLKSAGQWQRLWLAADSMPSAEWRALCQVLRHLPG